MTAPPTRGDPVAATLVPFHDGDADVRLLCFPYAGGGARLFRPWQDALPPGVGVSGVCLPGREHRYREPPLDDWAPALELLLAELGPWTRRGRYAFYGHSLGARLAYELTHRLVALGYPAPVLLVVSACRAPGEPPRFPDMHSMDGPTLRERLRVMRGVPDEVLANRALMARLEPVLRADLRIAETWDPTPGPLAVPVLALCGEHDDIDPYPAMAGWARHTTAGFAIHEVPAGHFFLNERPDLVVAALAAHLETA